MLHTKLKTLVCIIVLLGGALATSLASGVFAGTAPESAAHSPAAAAHEPSRQPPEAAPKADVDAAHVRDIKAALAKRLHDDNAFTRRHAAEALWQIDRDPAAVAAMIADLKSPDWQVRRNAAEALGGFGVAAKAAVPALAEALKDASSFVRSSAALALWRIGEHPDAIATLVADLADPDSAGHRSTAAYALGLMGAKATAAVGALLEALKDNPWSSAENSFFHIAAAQALWRINKHPAAVPALTPELAEPEAGRRMAAAEALGRIGKEAKAAVPALIGALGDEKDYVRRAAAEALGAIGAEDAVPALLKALQEKGRVRVCAAEALWRINHHPAALPALAEAVQDPTEHAAYFAHVALRHLGAEAKAVVPALTAALKDGNASKRLEAAVTLWRVNKDPAALGVLVAALQEGDGRLRVAAAKVLWQAEKHPAAVPALVKALNDKDVNVRAEAAEALWDINKHPAAVATLLDILKEHGEGIRALGRIGAAFKAAAHRPMR
jgi:HEAT repeat protein